MNKLGKQLDLAKEAVELIKEFKKLETPISDVLFTDVKSNNDGSKIIINHEYDGILEYELKKIASIFEEEIEGFGPFYSGFYDGIEELKNYFNNDYEQMNKEEFMKHVGKVYYMQFRCEEIYERLKSIQEEYYKI